MLLAVIFEEDHGRWAAQRMNEHAGTLKMSTVNLTETLIRVRDRQPMGADQIEHALLGSGIQFIPPDINQARIAAQARLRFPLNLGDCFVYALAVAEDAPVLTLDADFRHTDHPMITP